MTTLVNASRPRSTPAQNLIDRPKCRPFENVRTIRVGLLGCGTVGREVAAQLIGLRDQWVHSDRVRIEVPCILIRDRTRDRGLDPGLLVTQFDDVLDARPDVIIEAIGGVQPAGRYVEAALFRGIPVITANKSLIAHDGERLRAIAKRHHAALFCEACVGGAVPILAALKQLRGDRVLSIRGIINGTCNDILSRMTDERLTFDESLQQAIIAGFAEPDPSADISGRDSAEKLCVLAAAAGFAGITPDEVDTSGIESITRADIDAAKSHRYIIKLIATLETDDEAVSCRVCPTLVARRHSLAKVNGPENLFVVDCELAGTLTLRGRGAGPKPTASAILGDLRRTINGEGGTISHLASSTRSASDAFQSANAESPCWFVSFNGTHQPLTPASALEVFASHGIDVIDVVIHSNRIDVFTGPCRRTVLIGAYTSIDANGRPFVAEVLE